MALHPSLLLNPSPVTGIVIVLFGRDQLAGATIERASDVSGSPGTFSFLASLDSVADSGTAYVDVLPLDNQPRWYRAYHTELGYDNGPTTAAVQGIPTVITNPDFSGKPWLSDTIMPVLRETPSENGLTGSLVLTPVDPQRRITKVEAWAGPANTTGSFATLPLSGGVYTITVPLVEKQPSKIAYRLSAISVYGSEVITQENAVRFALGARPIPPEVNYQIANDGTLTVVSRGDSDTNLQHIMVKTDVAPTSDELDAATGSYNEFVSRTAAFTYVNADGSTRKLIPGQKFYIGARSYNTLMPGGLSAQGSDIVVQTDQWIAPSDATATVSVTSVGIDSNRIYLNNLVLGALTSQVKVFAKEYKSDPGAAVNVSQIGYQVVTPPLVNSGSLAIPVANPSNYMLVTLMAFDALNRLGTGEQVGTGSFAGTVNIKAQAASAAQPAANPPTDLTLTASGSAAVDLAIVIPSSNLPAALRIMRNGVALPDVTRTASAGGTQHWVDTTVTPGATYTYQVFSVNAVGVVSSTGSPSRSITLGASTLPTPTASAGAFSQAAGGYTVTVTPGTGSPGGETWVLEHATESQNGTTGVWTGYGAWTQAESNTSTTFFHTHGAGALNVHCKIRITATKVGYSNSGTSAEVITLIPKWTP